VVVVAISIRPTVHKLKGLLENKAQIRPQRMEAKNPAGAAKVAPAAVNPLVAVESCNGAT
jgi:hypothetical protein